MSPCQGSRSGAAAAPLTTAFAVSATLRGPWRAETGETMSSYRLPETIGTLTVIDGIAWEHGGRAIVQHPEHPGRFACIGFSWETGEVTSRHDPSLRGAMHARDGVMYVAEWLTLDDARKVLAGEPTEAEAAQHAWAEQQRQDDLDAWADSLARGR